MLGGISRTLLRLASMVCLTLMTLVGSGDTQPVASCDRVVSYFTFPSQGSQSDRFEWRVFDPSRGTDTLFLALDRGFQGVRWDTSFDAVWFSAGDSLYRVEWRVGAKPGLITDLPPGTRYWWFDPDSGCLQALRLLKELRTDDPYDERHDAELWQLDRGASGWHMVRADSVYADLDEEQWFWFNGNSIVNETASVTLDDLASEAWDVTWMSGIAAIDTATYVVSKDTSHGYTGDQWFFLPLRAAPARGMAFHLAGSMAPEHNWSGVVGPLYFVDLDHRTKTRIDGNDDTIMRSLGAEHCGFVLIPGAGSPIVLDASGRRVFSHAWYVEDAVWVGRPH